MIGRYSRYVASVIYKDGEEEFFGTRHKIDTSERPDDLFHTVVEGEHLDMLAYHYFGRSDLWWIICDYNDIFYPLDIEPGSVLRIPSREHVYMRIFQ